MRPISIPSWHRNQRSPIRVSCQFSIRVSRSRGHEFRRSAGDPASADLRARAAALSKRILDPLRPSIGGARLLLSPDGALNLVPMGALVNERGRYLAERFEISYLTSGRDLLRFGADSPLSSNPVVMANPDYGQRVATARVEPATRTLQERSEELDRGGFTFRALPGTAQEGEAIGALLQSESAHILTGAQATEANLKRVHGPRILHLATHGFFLNDQEAVSATRDARASAMTASSRRWKLRGWICAAPSWWCSLPARPASAKYAAASGLPACAAG